MALNERLGRWIMASVARHFMDARGDVFMFVEPQIPRDTQNQSRYYELRMDGPHITRVSKNEYFVDGDINILCTVQQTEDTYDIYDLSGPMQAAMVDIPLFRCGPDDPPDDGSQFGCWYLQQSKREKVKGSMLGRIEPKTPLVQYMVSGIYHTSITGE